MRNEEICIIIDPLFLRKIRDVSYNYVKYNSSEKIANDLISKFKLTDIFNVVMENTDRPIVYGIKNKDEKLVVEIYLYYTDRQRGCDIEEYYEDSLSLWSALNSSVNADDIRERFIKASLDKKITMCSFDIYEDGRIEDKFINMYSGDHKYCKYILDDNTIVEIGAEYVGLASTNLRAYLNSQPTIMQEHVPAIMDDLLVLCPNLENVCERVIFTHKRYINSIGIYLPPVNYDVFKGFIKKRFNGLLRGDNLSIYNDDITFKDLPFSIYMNYDLSTGMINACGFFDYF
jgi:hypothetical protein